MNSVAVGLQLLFLPWNDLNQGSLKFLKISRQKTLTSGLQNRYPERDSPENSSDRGLISAELSLKTQLDWFF